MTMATVCNEVALHVLAALCRKTGSSKPTMSNCNWERMRPSDVMELFDLVEVGDQVQIV